MKKIFSILFLFCSLLSYATKYYVKNGGNDEAAGTSDGTAWATLTKVNGSSFIPGDSVLFKRGNIWRESLVVSNSGTSASYIYFGAYGTGLKPKILGSIQAITWTDQGGNVWKSATSCSNPYPGTFNSDLLFFETTGSISWGTHQTDTASLTAEYHWTWLSNYLYVYSPADPDSRYTKIEAPQRRPCIDLNNKEYISINSIDMFYARWAGVSYNWSFDMVELHGLNVDSCNIGWMGSKDLGSGYGTEIAYSDMHFSYDTVHNCGRRSVSLDIYGSGFTARRAYFDKCVFYDGYHTTGIDLSVGSGAYTGSWDSVFIRRCLFYESPTAPIIPYSNQIFLQNYDYAGSGATVNHIFILCNIFKYPTSASVNIEGVTGVKVYNNTFYEINTTVTTGFHYALYLTTSSNNADIKNNIFYNTLAAHTSGAGTLLTTYNLDEATIDADHNLYYRISNAQDVINANGVTYEMNDKALITAAWGWEANGVFADPLFVSTTDYNLQAASPAIGAGIGVGINTDFNGNVMNNPPDLGAIAYNSTPPTPTDLPICSFSGESGWYSNIKSISVTVMGGWTDDGGGTITDAGIVISTSANPTTSDRKISFNDMIATSGYFNENITGLRGNTTYHMRIFATNESGTAYSADQTLTTSVYVPIVEKGPVVKQNGKFVKE